MRLFSLFSIVACLNLQATPIDKVIQPFIESKKARGVVTLVADGERALHLSAQGLADVKADRKMATTDLFWIASMTKPMTAACIMMLQDEGKLKLSDPVSKYLPQFHGERITILQCLNHTSGLAELRQVSKSLEEYMIHVTKVPRISAPGETWRYCQSGINTVGRIVEVVSGKTLPEFMKQHLFDPLSMTETSFYPSEKRCKTLAKTYDARTKNDHPIPIKFLGLKGKNPWKTDRYPLANGGLFSTAEDCMAFCQMLLNEGEYKGVRILSQTAVKEMTSVTTRDLIVGFTPGNGWGVGMIITREPQGTTATLSPGSYGHGGAYGTQMWIDPVKKRIHILMVQRTGVKNGDDSDLRRVFHEAAVQL